MTDETPHPDRVSSEPERTIEPIHAAFLVSREVMGVFNSSTVVLWLSAASGLYLGAKILFRMVGAPPFSAELLAAVALITWLVKRWHAFRNQPEGPAWARARNGLASDPKYRLRLVGEGAQINALATKLEKMGDQYGEPLITRTVMAISLADDRVYSDGSPRPGMSGAMSDTAKLVKMDLSIGQFVVTTLAGVAATAGFYFAAKYAVGWFPPMLAFTFLWASSGGMAVLALLSPVYIRVAPGSLDILRFGWVPSNIPRFERFDLRTCGVLVDIRVGVIRLWDEERGTRRGVFINAGLSGAGRQQLCNAVLAAARSRVPTPPLPTDALTG